ncbi:MAG: hypothetical protein HWE10_09665 [Gammaproteobacteria bacterium]|nr:hypothetical protein [Gammaproteobacteria bacterium]
MKKTLLTSLLAATTLVSAYAQAELSANVAVTSNYIWRGMEQTDGGPAVQGGVDYADASGFYVGTWASNVDDWGVDASFELDLYGGYTGTAGGWDYDIGYVLFMYPGADVDLDFGEIYGSVSKGALSLGVAVLANANGADFGDSIYLSADYSIDAIEGFDTAVHVGSYSGDFSSDAIDFGATIGKDFWTVGASMMTEGDDELKLYASAAWDFDL